MAAVILLSVLLVLLSTAIHYEALRLLSFSLPLLRIASRARLLFVILATFLAHGCEILLYALAFHALANWFALGVLHDIPHPAFATFVYFSAETYTSLGFGDITPGGALRMLAGVESLNGLLLIGWSASYTYIAMERFWVESGNTRKPFPNSE